MRKTEGVLPKKQRTGENPVQYHLNLDLQLFQTISLTPRNSSMKERILIKVPLSPSRGWNPAVGWVQWGHVLGRSSKPKLKVCDPKRASGATKHNSGGSTCMLCGLAGETPYCGSKPACRSPEKPNSIILIRMPLNLTKQIISSRDRYCVGGQNYFACPNWRLKLELFG